MKLYKGSEIINKHGEAIYLFNNQPGNTEIDKFISLLNTHNIPFSGYNAIDKNGNGLSCVVVMNNNELEIVVFNALGEKI